MDPDADTHDEHVIEAIGRCRVVIRNGRVVDVGAPVIERCPLARRFAIPVLEITPDAVKANIQNRIDAYGMCTPNREILSDRDFVIFGASEMISAGIRSGLLDAAVIACEGAGTVIAPVPALVQGIGGRMSGLVKTSPIPELIRRIEAEGGIVLDAENASIDQLAGVSCAQERGFHRIAVTVADPAEGEEIRKRFPDALIFGVHTTGLAPDQARRLVEVCDIVTACASRWVREYGGKSALLQAGTAVPVFALTQRGKDLILEKIRYAKEMILLKSERLPFSGENVPTPLR
jgi:putative methanogenesis marker protein 8